LYPGGLIGGATSAMALDGKDNNKSVKNSMASFFIFIPFDRVLHQRSLKITPEPFIQSLSLV
jgi:hypothetical protein